jgi:hypothetical protein
MKETLMRTSIFAGVVVAGTLIAFPATAQQKPGPQQAAPSEQTSDQMHHEGLKATGQANEQMQPDADIKTRNSGASGYVGDQDKPGGLKTTGQANEQMQRDADIKTRNSGASGYVGDQEKPGASAHPPGNGK